MIVCDKCKNVTVPAKTLTLTVAKNEDIKKGKPRTIFSIEMDLCETCIPSFGTDLKKLGQIVRGELTTTKNKKANHELEPTGKDADPDMRVLQEEES